MMRWLRRAFGRFAPDVYQVTFWEPVSVVPAVRVQRDGRTYEYEATILREDAPALRRDLKAQLRAWLSDHDPDAIVDSCVYGHDVEADGAVRVKMTAYIRCDGSSFPCPRRVS